MSAPDPVALQSEPTPQGEQMLVPDVRPADLPRPPKRASRRWVTPPATGLPF